MTKVPITIIEPPANWWHAVAANPDKNLLVMADTDAWTLNSYESLLLSLSGLANLGVSRLHTTNEQIASFSFCRMQAFTAMPDPRKFGDLVVIGNN